MNFEGGFFVTWKQAGDYGAVHVSYLGRHYDTSYAHREVVLPEEQTALLRSFAYWATGCSNT